MLHHWSEGLSSEKKKKNLTLTLTFNLILFFITKFVFLSLFLQIYHFTVYLGLIFYEGEMSVKLYVKMTLIF